jgi:hypothetical protein
LEDRSSEIGVIVELIRGISSRTDMLALNATIESIRAGEHGRGFAIIAEEIRKLAERTAAATREIGTLVEAIQADTQESIRGLGEEQAETQRESHRIRETGSSLARISQVVEKSARLVEGISRSTNDQVVTTQELVRAMQRISDVTQQTQERTAQARAFIKALNRSCEPWQRLAALDSILKPAGARAASGSFELPEKSTASGAEPLISTSLESDHAAYAAPHWSPHGNRSVRLDPGREPIGSERLRCGLDLQPMTSCFCTPIAWRLSPTYCGTRPELLNLQGARRNLTSFGLAYRKSPRRQKTPGRSTWPGRYVASLS